MAIFFVENYGKVGDCAKESLPKPVPQEQSCMHIPYHLLSREFVSAFTPNSSLMPLCQSGVSKLSGQFQTAVLLGALVQQDACSQNTPPPSLPHTAGGAAPGPLEGLDSHVVPPPPGACGHQEGAG